MQVTNSGRSTHFTVLACCRYRNLGFCSACWISLLTKIPMFGIRWDNIITRLAMRVLGKAVWVAKWVAKIYLFEKNCVSYCL